MLYNFSLPSLTITMTGSGLEVLLTYYGYSGLGN